jgi:hypothetical protein
MGKGSEWIAAGSDSENNGIGSRKAHHVSGSSQEDCCVSKSEMGEVEGAAEEGRIITGSPLKYMEKRRQSWKGESVCLLT